MLHYVSTPPARYVEGDNCALAKAPVQHANTRYGSQARRRISGKSPRACLRIVEADFHRVPHRFTLAENQGVREFPLLKPTCPGVQREVVALLPAGAAHIDKEWIVTPIECTLG